jgi:hypothetical protein
MEQDDVKRPAVAPSYRVRGIALLVVGIAFIGLAGSSSAWAWGNEGHEIVAIIAADNLSPAAQAGSRYSWDVR